MHIRVKGMNEYKILKNQKNNTENMFISFKRLFFSHVRSTIVNV